MTRPDLTPRELTRRFFLREISRLEAQREQLIARLVDLQETGSDDFRKMVVELGALLYTIDEAKRHERRYRTP